jgi:cysteine desulfurase
MTENLYFDNGATTQVDPRVVEEMLPYWTKYYGNPSSLHAIGREAKDAIEQCRKTMAEFLGANGDEIIFTSSGTESNNMALKGIAFANKNRGNHIIVSSVEHDCVLNTCKWLQKQGFSVTYLPVDADGMVDVAMVQQSITAQTILVSIMQANNEIGTIQPIAEIGDLCKQQGVYLHTDACQTFGKIPLQVDKFNVDLATISAHKIHGPKGIGALYVKRGVIIEPLLHGGGQERGLRSATENVAAIVGFSKAAELCMTNLGQENQRIVKLRDKIIDTILDRVAVAYLNGHRVKRLPGNINFGFHGLEGEAIKILLKLDEEGISVSSGSACSSNEAENKPSHVLLAIGKNPVEARGALRITLGRFTEEKHIDYFLTKFFEVLQGLKSISTFGLI